ncbi:hypothetical protein [Calothrix sp. UHCC 0171]|uniref:hypothetical protein n=1 Tax=Calothrix sp. UHCC 0171 TaxID=3110245 RepID=UPI002B219941|nr:hypothetical protein [Calothrix sp. UHCC 0171]MEA5573269.1 hypothetical protein [Calothrix sp. UHCC 0171]
MQARRQIEFVGLPLAVYREIAAHLRQVEGVKVGLISQSSQQFDYNQSQIEGLWIDFSSNSSISNQQQVEEILAYYESCYGNRREIAA